MKKNQHSGARIARYSAFCAALLVSAAAHAQSYPAKPINLVIPLQAGSASDVMLRTVAQKMSANIGQQIVITNQPGASGMIGAERIARAAPDGYTIGAMGPAVMTVVPNLNPNAGYHPLKSFEPISLVGGITFVLIVHPSLPVKTVKELAALAKAKPGQLDFSSGGSGSSQHIAMELFKSVTGTSFTHVPHRGATQAVLDVLSGRVPVMFSALSVVLGNIEQGKTRALAVASAQRSPLLPQVPTMIEAGLPGFLFTSWNGLYAPQGTPKPIVDRLHAETAKAVADPGVRNALLKLGIEPEGSSPAELAAVTRDGYARMAKLIRETGLKLD